MQVVNTTLMLSPSKFLYLKYLSIYVNGFCDCLSLVYFLGAAPSLETFKLRVSHCSPCKYIFGCTHSTNITSYGGQIINSSI